MSEFFYLIPVSIALGMLGLAVFLWSLKARQYDDLQGAAERILYDDDTPAVPKTGETQDGDTFDTRSPESPR